MKRIKIDSISILAAVMLTALFVAACDEAETADEPAQPPEAQEVSPPAEGGDHHHDDHQPGTLAGDLIELPPVPDTLDELPEGVNIVQFEMQILTAAMQNILRLIADDRLDEIPGQISQVHPAYELTHQAINEGLYRPPVNPEQIEAFEAFDDAFHDDLRALIGAAREDDLQATTERYTDLVQGCTSCHGQFRFP